tara:strand:+ start:5308 stop:7602 length:2295 start_codon:yes stop_codon:yes gene_type:complete
MLEKINHIKNIGRFYDLDLNVKASSTNVLKKFSLIYADNGTGKSTISTILKSLSHNDPQKLIEKRTIGATDISTVSLQINSNEYIFKDDKWNKTTDIEIRIFDEEFVAKNVFLPNGVDLQNSRELFNYIVLGEENVDKIQEVKNLNNFISPNLKEKIKNAEINLKEAATIKDIKILDNVDRLDYSSLKTKENNVNRNDTIIKHAEYTISEKKLDKIVHFENIPYKESVSINIDSLSVAAEYKIHVHTHNKWIKDGMKILKQNEESCPFCFQNIKENDTIATYKTFFSEEYDSLRNQVSQQIKSVECIYSNAAIKNVIDLVERNNERCVFWNKLDNAILKSIDPDISLEETINNFKSSLEKLLERKKNNLLEVISPNENELEGLNQEQKIKKAIANYNIKIEDVNHKILALKDASRNIEKLKIKNDEDRITIICNKVKYYDKKTAEIYKTLESDRKKKQETEEKIKTIRSQIDQNSKDLLKKYENNINKYLKNFGVEFSIKGVTRSSDSSRKENVSFSIQLKGKDFKSSGSNESPYKLSNTLSSGDKSTLAFAFFVAKYRDQNAGNTIFVFDDPITSLDFFRRRYTKTTIMEFVKNSVQIIILTHSIEFAKLFKHEQDSRFVKIIKNNSSSGISYYSYNKFNDMGIEKHSNDYNIIKDYLNEPNPNQRINVIRAIRPCVETIIKQYRTDMHDLSLGQMIKELRNENKICPDYINTLKFINDSVTKDNHGSADIDAGSHENISDAELSKLCKETIKISETPIKYIG